MSSKGHGLLLVLLLVFTGTVSGAASGKRSDEFDSCAFVYGADARPKLSLDLKQENGWNAQVNCIDRNDLQAIYDVSCISPHGESPGALYCANHSMKIKMLTKKEPIAPIGVPVPLSGSSTGAR